MIRKDDSMPYLRIRVRFYIYFLTKQDVAYILPIQKLIFFRFKIDFSSDLRQNAFKKKERTPEWVRKSITAVQRDDIRIAV